MSERSTVRQVSISQLRASMHHCARTLEHFPTESMATLQRLESEEATDPGGESGYPARSGSHDIPIADPAATLRAINQRGGGPLDMIGEMLGVRRKRIDSERRETDAAYRERLIDRVCSCRDGVHVLGRDPKTWERCQCGMIRMGTDDGKREPAKRVAKEFVPFEMPRMPAIAGAPAPYSCAGCGTCDQCKRAIAAGMWPTSWLQPNAGGSVPGINWAITSVKSGSFRGATGGTGGNSGAVATTKGGSFGGAVSGAFTSGYSGGGGGSGGHVTFLGKTAPALRPDGFAQSAVDAAKAVLLSKVVKK